MNTEAFILTPYHHRDTEITEVFSVSSVSLWFKKLSGQMKAIGQKPRLPSTELRRQRGADAEDRGEAPDDRAGDRDQADSAEDDHADDYHGQIAAQPIAAVELLAGTRAGHQRSDGVEDRHQAVDLR